MPLYKESKEKQTTLLELNMQRQYEQKLTTQKHEFEAQLELQRKQIAELTKTVRDLEESQREQKEQFAQQRIKLEAELKNKDNLIEALTVPSPILVCLTLFRIMENLFHVNIPLQIRVSELNMANLFLPNIWIKSIEV